TQRVAIGERARHGIEARNEFGRLVRWAQLGFQRLKAVVIEAEVRGGEALFQDGCTGEQRERGALDLRRRREQHFALAFKEGAGHAAIHRAREADGALGEREMDGAAVERDIADAVHAFSIEPHAAQFAVERDRRRGSSRRGNALRERHAAPKQRHDGYPTDPIAHDDLLLECALVRAHVTSEAARRRAWPVGTLAFALIFALTFALTFALLTASAAAQTIYLKNGGAIRGEHVREANGRV